MEIETEDILLQKCRTLIEGRLGWGKSETWVTRDYELLGRKIQEATNVSLSIVTLKRIWGKIRYDSKPTMTTLNTLAQYLGFDNWRSFQQGQPEFNGHGHPHSVQGPDVTNAASRRTRYILVFLIVAGLAAGFIVFWINRPVHRFIDPGRFAFSSKKVVEEGVPNSVIFDYDASSATPSDSIFIQQSWDKRLRQSVAFNQKQHTSIYYYPGFFQAKLIINDQIVKEHNLFIKTTGWITVIEQKPVPIYIKESDAIREGSMSLPVDKFGAFNVPLQPTPPWIAFYNVRSFGDLASDDLIFETEVRNDYKEGSSACQHTEVHLLFEGAALVIPLSIPGCVSELNLMGKEGKKVDLTALGCDFSTWATVSCRFKDKTLGVWVNHKFVTDFPLPAKPIKVAGIAYRFQGTGSVNYLRLSRNSGTLVYEDMFGK